MIKYIAKFITFPSPYIHCVSLSRPDVLVDGRVKIPTENTRLGYLCLPTVLYFPSSPMKTLPLVKVENEVSEIISTL